MTDRYICLTVVLEAAIRQDDAQAIIEAIKMVRGVLDVQPRVEDSSYHSALIRTKHEIAEKLFKILE